MRAVPRFTFGRYLLAVIVRLVAYGLLAVGLSYALLAPAGANPLAFAVIALLSIGSFVWPVYVLVVQTRRYLRFRAGPRARV